MELAAAVKAKAQQVEELEIFQKQAKLLLNENDGKNAKMVRFYERKESDFMEQMQQEKFKWSEKRSIMQSKIDNLQVFYRNIVLVYQCYELLFTDLY